jgi:CheY-like chemotaxis protein
VNHGSGNATVSSDRPSARSISPLDVLTTRVHELETLCAEVYAAAAGLGLPKPLLNRLWAVAAARRAPHTWAADPGPATPPVPRAERARLPELRPLATRCRVMVVDDDPMLLNVVMRILSLENFELLSASSGPEALRKLAGSGRIDLLITDFAMPEMKGHELAEQMRKQFPDLRVLYQTGFSDLLFENRTELDAHSAFVEKPFTARGLREATRFILFGAINPKD